MARVSSQNGIFELRPMIDWHALSEPIQLQLAEEAMRQASSHLAAYAEALADQMETGALSDRGGNEALRLFANLVRSVHTAAPAVAGHA